MENNEKCTWGEILSRHQIDSDLNERLESRRVLQENVAVWSSRQTELKIELEALISQTLRQTESHHLTSAELMPIFQKILELL